MYIVYHYKARKLKYIKLRTDPKHLHIKQAETQRNSGQLRDLHGTVFLYTDVRGVCVQEIFMKI